MYNALPENCKSVFIEHLLVANSSISDILPRSVKCYTTIVFMHKNQPRSVCACVSPIIP